MDEIVAKLRELLDQYTEYEGQLCRHGEPVSAPFPMVRTGFYFEASPGLITAGSCDLHLRAKGGPEIAVAHIRRAVLPNDTISIQMAPD
jgi:hypothetical protein